MLAANFTTQIKMSQSKLANAELANAEPKAKTKAKPKVKIPNKIYLSGVISSGSACKEYKKHRPTKAIELMVDECMDGPEVKKRKIEDCTSFDPEDIDASLISAIQKTQK